MQSERQWVRELAPRLEQALASLSKPGKELEVGAHKKLYYAYELFEYSDSKDDVRVSDYQTDMLVFERRASNGWTPLVVIECKLGQVTTHDALTYSTKAATHKNVHPFLRYGILIGGLGQSVVPGRLAPTHPHAPTDRSGGPK